jgi:hypothetical protein
MAAACVCVQHMDGMKGVCALCVLDMPPVRLPEVALWRRLLLGEGDGANGVHGNTAQYGSSKQQKQQRQRRSRRYFSDSESPYAAAEMEAWRADEGRAAVSMACLLRDHGFPFVSVLAEGLPSLIAELVTHLGSVEPALVGHDHKQYVSYMRNQGHTQHIPEEWDEEWDEEETPNDGAHGNEWESKLLSVTPKNIRPIEGAAELSPLEVTQLAYRMAVSLQHTHMEAVLLEKMNTYQGFDRR